MKPKAASPRDARYLRALARRVEREGQFISRCFVDDAALFERLEILADRRVGDSLVFNPEPAWDDRVVFLCFAAAMAETGDL